MQIELTPEQDDVVRHAIASGRIARPEDAVAQAMADWVERERERSASIASLDEADAEYGRGESIRVDTEEQRHALVDDIVTRSQARLMSFSLIKRAEADLDEIADDIGEEQGADASRLWLDAITARFDALG